MIHHNTKRISITDKNSWFFYLFLQLRLKDATWEKKWLRFKNWKTEQSSSITMYKTVAQNTSTSVIKRQTENVYKADVLQCKWQIRILKDQGYIYQ